MTIDGFRDSTIPLLRHKKSWTSWVWLFCYHALKPQTQIRQPVLAETEDLYEILQVHPAANPDIIDAAYRLVRRKPDMTNQEPILPSATQLLRRFKKSRAVRVRFF